MGFAKGSTHQERVNASARSAWFVEPDQAVSTCPVPSPKIFPFAPDPNHFHNSRHPVPHEGRIAIVTDAGWDAVDTVTPLTNGADVDGEVVWSRRPDAGVKFCGMRCRPCRARHAEIREAMVANKPGHQGEHEGNR